MANSKYQYVKQFEQDDILLPNTWIVVRIDGRGFHNFSKRYRFVKPNDSNALGLMNAAAEAVMREIPDIVVSYGVSDEYSFVFHRQCSLFDRRASKLVSTVVSTFSAYYVHTWPAFFPDQNLNPPLPTFDGRAVQYPSSQNLRDYMSWRQVDCHINNLYNTTFWTLVQNGGLSAKEAEARLAGTVAAAKNEILFSEFKVNYNREPEMYKKGSVIFWNAHEESQSDIKSGTESGVQPPVLNQGTTRDKFKNSAAAVMLEHVDIIKDDFWDKRPWLLSDRPWKPRKQ